MSAPQGMSVSEQIRCGTGPMYQHMRGIIVEKGRVIDGVRGLLIVHLTYGAESCPIGFYELTFTDRATVRQWWHFEQQKPLLPARARALVDMDRLLPHERQLFEEKDEPTIADWLRQGGDQSLEHHIVDCVEAQNHSYKDISAITLQAFHYEGPPDGEWKTSIPADPLFCKIGFPDGTYIDVWWSIEQRMPLSYQQARQILKGGPGPLDFATQQFLENYLEPKPTTATDFTARPASAQEEKAAGPADQLD